MANLFTDLINTFRARILNKTQPLSIKKGDVDQSLEDLAKLALLVPVSDPSLFYPKDYRVRDSAYNLFVAKADDVNGDTTNAANWQQVPSGPSGSTKIHDLSTTSTTNQYTSTDGTITSYASNELYIVTPDVANSAAPTYGINALAALPILKTGPSGTYVPLLPGDFSWTSILLYRGSYFLLISISSGGSEITDSTARTNLQTAANWLDPYDNIASFGGRYNGPAITCKEHDYFVDDVYKYEKLKMSGTYVMKRFQHTFPIES